MKYMSKGKLPAPTLRAVDELDDSEEEASRRAKLAQRKKMQELLLEEKKNSMLNNLKIQQSWRRQMRLAKVEALRKEFSNTSTWLDPGPAPTV